MKWSHRFNLFVAGTTALIILAVSQQEAFSGKPKPPPPPPPVLYEVQFWSVPNGNPIIDSINNRGQVVGWYSTASGSQHAFLYDPAFNPTSAIDLNSIVAAPSGWVVASAVDINDQGVIVGYLETTDGAQATGFILDITEATPALHPLPTQGSTNSWGRRINEYGDVTGVYERADGTWGAYVYNLLTNTVVDLNITSLGTISIEINNPTQTHDTQVCLQLHNGSAFGIPLRWTRGHGFEQIPGTNTLVDSINDSGTVCGSTYSGKPSRQYAFLYPTSLQILTAVSGGAHCLNSAGDFLNSPNVYHSTRGLLSIGNLIDTSDPDGARLISVTGGSVGGQVMNDRIPGADFGQIAGMTQLSNGSWLPYLLTPKAPH